MSQRDSIYAAPRTAIDAFTFDEAVARVFPDMLKRSIPGYTQIVAYLGLWAAEYAQPNSRIYDLGCSLGAATFAMRERVTQPNVTMVAVDNAPAMLAKLASTLEAIVQVDRRLSWCWPICKMCRLRTHRSSF